MKGVAVILHKKKAQLVGRRKCKQSRSTPEFSRKMNEILEMLVNSCIRDLDRLRMNFSSSEGGRERKGVSSHAVS